MDSRTEQREGRYAAAAQVGAWLCMGAVNVIAAWLAVPMSGMDNRLMVHLYAIGQVLAIGVVAAFIVLAWRRLGPQHASVGYVLLAL